MIIVGLTFLGFINNNKAHGVPQSHWILEEKQGACHIVALPLFTLKKGMLWQKKKIMKIQVFHHPKI